MRFSNCKTNFLKNINSLPDVLIDEIYLYIPKTVTLFLSKKNYLQDHYLLKNYINKQQKNIEYYFRAMIRQDNDFVLKQLLVENFEKWFNMKNYYYKTISYPNYLAFIQTYALENESTKCNLLILSIFEEQGISKNRHKKNVNKYIRWTKFP